MTARGSAGEVLATGFFDGVHVGHRRIIDGADSVLTFRNHPLSVLSPDKVPVLLMSEAERLSELASGGRDVSSPQFTGEFASMSPEAFVSFLRREYPRLKKVRCGANWTFGAGGRGNPDMLRDRGIEVEVVPYEEYLGAPVSSTRIRAELSAGNVVRANAMLGRPFSFSGEVCAGKGAGKRMGFPTLNVIPSKRLLLPFGVYAVETGFGAAVANWGVAPTMCGVSWKSPVFEVHLLEGASAPEGMGCGTVKIGLLSFLRQERKFASVTELSGQIAADVAAARGCFRSSDRNRPEAD